jgi:hypothetical protein
MSTPDSRLAVAETMLIMQSIKIARLLEIEKAARKVCESHLRQSRPAAPPIQALLVACGYVI